MLEQFVFHLRHPIGQRRVNKAVNYEFYLAIWSKVRVENAVFVFCDQRLALVRVIFRVQNELRVDDVPRQRENIERPMN